MPEPLRADKAAAKQPPAPPMQPTASSADDQTGGLPVAQHSGQDSLGFLAPAQGADELGRLAHYRVLKELGRGGMGCVLLAEDTKLQRQVALKVMLPQFAEDAKAKERFLREARAVRPGAEADGRRRSRLSNYGLRLARVPSGETPAGK